MSKFCDNYMRNKAKYEQARTSKANRASVRDSSDDEDGNMSWSLFSYCYVCDSDDESNVSSDSVPNTAANSASNNIADSASDGNADSASNSIADSASDTSTDDVPPPMCNDSDTESE